MRFSVAKDTPYLMQFNINLQAFIALLRAGLWEREVQLSQYKGIDYDKILISADEQSVVGLVTAGLDKVVDVKVPRKHPTPILAV